MPGDNFISSLATIDNSDTGVGNDVAVGVANGTVTIASVGEGGRVFTTTVEGGLVVDIQLLKLILTKRTKVYSLLNGFFIMLGS